MGRRSQGACLPVLELVVGRRSLLQSADDHSIAAAGPGIIILLAGLILPESPSSLAENGHIERARHVRPLP